MNGCIVSSVLIRGSRGTSITEMQIHRKLGPWTPVLKESLFLWRCSQIWMVRNWAHFYFCKSRIAPEQGDGVLIIRCFNSSHGLGIWALPISTWISYHLWARKMLISPFTDCIWDRGRLESCFPTRLKSIASIAFLTNQGTSDAPVRSKKHVLEDGIELSCSRGYLFNHFPGWGRLWLFLTI